MNIKNKIIYKDENTIIFNIKSKKFGNFEIIIDAEDFNKIKEYYWYVGKKPNAFYVITNINKNNKRTTLKLHRLIMDFPENMDIDHINHNTFDNRKTNLRICKHNKNTKNHKININNTSGFKGVTWFKYTKKWSVGIFSDGNRVHIGYFDDKIKAAMAYNEAAKKYHGEFANLNNV